MLPRPLPALLLAVDPGRRSGWAIVRGTLGGQLAVDVVRAGECGVWTSGPEETVRIARGYGCEAMIIETPGLGGTMTPIVTMGLGEARGAWLWLWRQSAGERERSVVVDVPAVTWRAAILGGGARSTEEWKAAARGHCDRVLGGGLGGDEAPDAACLGEYALHSLDVADALGPRRLGQLGWSEPRGAWVDGTWRAAP